MYQDDTELQDIRKRLLSRSHVNPVQRGIGSALVTLGGGKPSDDSSKLINQYYLKQLTADPEMDQLKKENLRSLSSNRGGGFFTVGEDGQAVPVGGVQPGMKPVPAGLTQPYQERASATAKGLETGNKFMEQALNGSDSSLGGNLPPGTTMKAGPLNIPMNPVLSPDQSSSVSASEVFKPLANDMKDKTSEGVFNSRFGDIGRTYRQMAASQPNALFTSYDPKLQEMQGKYNSIKRYVFGEGGKQLTPYEANVVMALINATGKSDQQYETDLGEATKIIESKSRLALGGRNAALGQKPSNDFSKMSDDELKRMAGIQ